MDNGNSQEYPAEKKEWKKKLEKLTGKPLKVPKEEPKEENNQDLNLYKDYDQPGYVYILLDSSGSMNTRDKISRARRGAISFIEKAFERNFKTGVIDFSLEAKVAVRPSTELKELESRVNKIKAAGSTNLSSALKLATKELKNLKGKKAVYIVTDGRPDDKYASLQAAKKLKKQGVQIMTLGTDDADQDFLEHISSDRDLSKMTTERELEANINSMASLLPVDKE